SRRDRTGRRRHPALSGIPTGGASGHAVRIACFQTTIMLLLSCTNLSRGFDAGPLFEDIGFELQAGDRVGLVGPNGVGKTTLLRLLAGLDRADDGTVRLHAGARVTLLKQQAEFNPGRTLFEEARGGLQELLAAH